MNAVFQIRLPYYSTLYMSEDKEENTMKMKESLRLLSCLKNAENMKVLVL